MPEEAEEAGLVTRKSEKRFTDWPGNVAGGQFFREGACPN